MPKSAQTYETPQHPFNQMDFMVRRLLNDVHTSLPCEVMECFPLLPGEEKANRDGIMGLVHVNLMIDQIDNEGNKIETQTIYNVPYGRLQAGTCAIVLDPVKGDRGWLQFAERDISTYKNTGERSLPASDRMLTQSDCWYFPGVLNKPPKVYIRLDQERGIIIEGDDRPIRIHTRGDMFTHCEGNMVTKVDGDYQLQVGGDCKTNAPKCEMNSPQSEDEREEIARQCNGCTGGKECSGGGSCSGGPPCSGYKKPWWQELLDKVTDAFGS